MTIRAIVTGALRLSTQRRPINVAIEVNPFVYNTVAQWYGEDVKMMKGAHNDNVGLAPVPAPNTGSRQRPPSGDSPVSWITDRIPSTIVPIVIVGAAVLLLCCCVPWYIMRRRARKWQGPVPSV